MIAENIVHVRLSYTKETNLWTFRIPSSSEVFTISHLHVIQAKKNNIVIWIDV